MKASTEQILQTLCLRYPKLECIGASVKAACEEWISCFSAGGKLLICGNGGSASDALHIVGELMKDFARCRPLSEKDREAIRSASEHAEYICDNLQSALPAIALVGSAALESAYANDRAPDLAFAQQVLGYGRPGDVLFAISTSGNSKNVIYAAEVAHAKGMKVIALTGESGGKLKDLCDVLVNVPEKETYRVQELHLPVYHALCLAVENEFFGE